MLFLQHFVQVPAQKSQNWIRYLKGDLRSPQDNIGSFLWFLPELGKSPLLKTPDTLVARYRETKLRTSQKLSSRWLFFIVQGVLCRLLRKKKQQWLCLGVNHTNYNPHLRHAHLRNSDFTVTGVTNCSLNGFKSC